MVAMLRVSFGSGKRQTKKTKVFFIIAEEVGW
jgi:hypothetical protein